MITGLYLRLIRLLLWANIVWLALVTYRSPARAWRALKGIARTRDIVRGGGGIAKYAKAGGRYFWELNSPGWPSSAFNAFIKAELQRADSLSPTPQALQTMVLAITRQCHLRCEHCFEWDALNGREILTLDNLTEIVGRFQRRGITQIQLSGGEPMRRTEAIMAVLNTAQPGTDFWLLTSGYGVTEEKAGEMKRAGLTGVNVSLDHWQPEAHNSFRGVDQAYEWAEAAATNARNAELALCLTICATREFVSRENLRRYAELAGHWGAGFIQVLEPRAVGHYRGMDVDLGTKELDLLQEFYLSHNYDPTYHHLPAVIYHGFHQRRLGCWGAGDRYLYVDTAGEVHACPFCQGSKGNCLTDSLDDVVGAMRSDGCAKFSAAAKPTRGSH